MDLLFLMGIMLFLTCVDKLARYFRLITYFWGELWMPLQLLSYSLIIY